MRKNIIITGKNRSGKSTVLNNVIEKYTKKVGFITTEIRGDNDRVGFSLHTHSGNEMVLAHVDLDTPYSVSRYKVDLDNLNAAVQEVSTFSKDDLLYLDEIGEMELFSENFKTLVTKYFESANTCLATLTSIYNNDFTADIKKRTDIILLEINDENRKDVELLARALIRKIEKAKNYVLEPERFSITGNLAKLHSEHADRSLKYVDEKWQCDCEFYTTYAICSHVIAIEEYITI